ncbi:DAR GTPase 2, mitochondrial [Cynara cardunculus var. scolymus]|uniref:DAR GTPase 2, mitochondrial n=1 Tax=Cynara cardunculus var. scolymus TaxID=59895 RepID=UPI000D624229|nr:DAR GTPase 2, mitochondrial [Cynara cardunculus var. scolymus]
MVGTASFVQKLGNSVKKVSESKSSSWWYNHHMRAASRAIFERIPLVDLVLEVRDARIPMSSGYEQLRYFPSSSRNIIILNKMDLANHSKTKEWMAYFKERNYIPYAINSHNKDSIKEFLNFLQARVRDIRRSTHSSETHTTTVMLVGIPNVGKSAFANSLHQIGRISAAEKGKLKHATVSPQPGQTRNIISLKIASHPNIYILDTPGILPPKILDAELSAKLALTGTIDDILIDQSELAQYFLSILNFSDEYKKWAKISTTDDDEAALSLGASSGGSEFDKRENQIVNDHTQDFVVRAVRRALFHEISAFKGNLEDEKDMVQLIEAQFTALRKAFNVTSNPCGDTTGNGMVAAKLINLYRTGRLGHYTLDTLPRISES